MHRRTLQGGGFRENDPDVLNPTAISHSYAFPEDADATDQSFRTALLSRVPLRKTPL